MFTPIARTAAVSILLLQANVLLGQDATPQVSQPTSANKPLTPTNSRFTTIDQRATGNIPPAPMSDSTGISAPGPNPMAVTIPVPASSAPIPIINNAMPLPKIINYKQKVIEEKNKSSQRMSAMLNSWIGVNINTLIMQWGAPSNEYKMPNGDIIYTWHNEHTIPIPLDITQMGGNYFGTGGGTSTVSCTISIFSDPNQKIFNWKWEGNGC